MSPCFGISIINFLLKHKVGSYEMIITHKFIQYPTSCASSCDWGNVVFMSPTIAIGLSGSQLSIILWS